MTRKKLPNSSIRKNLSACFLGIFFAVVILETCCQIYSLYLGKQWKAIKADPSHYYKASNNSTLGYELASNVAIDKGDRQLRINRFGIRDLENQSYDTTKIAILGDSIVFGNVLSQEQTLSALLQQTIDGAKVNRKIFNFGVPGYSLRELVEFLKVKNKIYDVDHIIYILNPNDFTRRDSIYEGADAGIYRMYHRPLAKSPWFIRKAIYRMMKYSSLSDYQQDKPSVRWYQWLFEGNMDMGFSYIKQMALYADEHESSLTIILLPAGVAYENNGSYALSDMYQNIADFLETNHISYINPTGNFTASAGEYFDATDHLTFEGNKFLVKILSEYIESKDQGFLTY